MKKSIYASCLCMLMATAAMAQPVSDRAVIPVAITLNQILRLHVTDGGNIEFVFNTIDDYKNGISNSTFYTTNVVLAASANWRIDFGAEDATMTGTDDPTNTLLINNVGFLIDWNGTNTCCAAGSEVVTGAPHLNSTATANGLALFPQILLTWGAVAASTNAGDILENNFEIEWQAGTAAAGGTTAMNATNLLVQSPDPDRYVVNVLLDLQDL
jgi:hypothetical protein